jgi:hypothetical protein
VQGIRKGQRAEELLTHNRLDKMLVRRHETVQAVGAARLSAADRVSLCDQGRVIKR